ncbi:MAG: tetratricopeptide repeat protein [bacterium]
MQTEESRTSKIETAIEFICYPLLFVIPCVVFREYFINYPVTQRLAANFLDPGNADMADIFLTLLPPAISVFILVSALLAAGFRKPEAPLDFTAILFLAEILFFGTFFVIFRSFESFRLPQQTMIQAGTFFVAFLYLLTSLIRGKLTIRHAPTLFISAGAVVAIALLSMLWSPNRMVSLKEIIHMVSVVLFFFLLLQYFRGRELLHLLIALVLLVSTLEAAIGVGQYFGLNTKIGLGSNFDPFSSLGNKNYVAEMLAMLVPFSIGCLFYFRHTAWRVLFVLNLGLMLVVIIVSQTRGSWAGLFAGLAVMVGFIALRFDRRILVRIVQGLAAALAIALIVATLSQRGIIFRRPDIPYAERITTIFKFGDMSIQSRFYIWGGTYEMIKKYPVTGVGIGAYKIRYLNSLKTYIRSKDLEKIPGFFKDVNAKEAHNEYFHILAEMGPLGLLAVIFFIASLVGFFLKGAEKCEKQNTRIIFLACFAALVSVGVSAIFGFPFHIVPTAMVIGALMAMMVWIVEEVETPAPAQNKATEPQPGNKKKKKKNKSQKKNTQSETAPAPPPGERMLTGTVQVPFPLFVGLLAVIAMAVIAILNGIFSINIQKANIVLKSANWFAQRGHVQAASDLYRESLKLDPYNGDIHLFLGMYYQKLKKLDEAIGEFKTARSYYDLPQVLLDLGAAYFEKGTDYFNLAEAGQDRVMQAPDGQPLDSAAAHEKGLENYALAADAFLESLAVFPNYPLPRYNLGLIHYQRGEYDKAIEMLQDAIRVQGDFYTAYFKLALAYERTGRFEEAEQAYLKTIQLQPSHADAYYNLGLLKTQLASNENVKADQARLEGRTDDTQKFTSQANRFFFKAKDLFARTVNYNPKHIKALNNLGNIYFRERNPDEAERLYLRALAIDPGYLNSRMNISLLYIETGRFADALPYLEPIMGRGLAPVQDVKARFMLGTCYIQLGRSKEAVVVLLPAYQKYINTGAGNSIQFTGATLRLTEALSSLGRFGECYNIMAAGMRAGAASQEVEWLYRTGLCGLNSGNTNDGANALRRLINKYPGSQQAEWARKTLAKF